MNPNAATEALSQPHWSPEDELLVWTVSRIHGGRRQGIEPDCHVVYAITPTHFVEQTRKYRASAQQCMELLLAGKRAGAIQRKIELDTIVAVRSDARSGRLVVRTLNGAHRLDPINDDEAEALREIATQLELRMPAGGATYPEFDEIPYQGGERRRSSERDEWLAVRSVENSRTEDEPDNTAAAHYHRPAPSAVDGSGLSAESPFAPEPAQANASVFEAAGPSTSDPAPPVEPGPPSTAEHVVTGHPGARSDPSGPSEVPIERAEPASPAFQTPAPDHPAPTMPDDITVVGGVSIVYQPVAGPGRAEPVTEVPPWIAPGGETAPSPMAPPDGEREDAGAVVDEPSEAVTADRSEDSGPGPELSDEQPGPAVVDEPSEAVTADRSEDSGPGPELSDEQPGPAVVDDPSGEQAEPAFDRRQRRALFQFRRKPEAAADPLPSTLDPREVEPEASSVPPALAGRPVAQSEWVPGQPDRRHHEDPRFPAVFDRRKHAEAPARSIFDRRGQAPPVGEADDPADSSPDEREPGAARSTVPERRDPPTLGPVFPAQSKVTGLGDSIGFNPDFDVNPYR